MHPRGEIRRRTVQYCSAHLFGSNKKLRLPPTYSVQESSLPIIRSSTNLWVGRALRTCSPEPHQFTDEAECSRNCQTAWVMEILETVGYRTAAHLKGSSTTRRPCDKYVGNNSVNETNDRIESYELEIRLPSGILKHWNSTYPNEVQRNTPGLRCFRFDQKGFGAVRPHDQLRLATFEYCTACAVAEHGGVAALVSEVKLVARVWVNKQEYRVEKTIKQLAMKSRQSSRSIDPPHMMCRLRKIGEQVTAIIVVLVLVMFALSHSRDHARLFGLIGYLSLSWH